MVSATSKFAYFLCCLQCERPLGQNFTNLLTVTDLKATQNDISVDTNGGLNMEIPIDLVMTGANNYGKLTNPLVNIEVYQYSGLRDCSWSKQPTFQKL